MRDQWVRLEGWLKATTGETVRSAYRRVGSIFQQGVRRAGAGLRHTTTRVSKHGPRPVAVVVDGVVQVDPVVAAQWHAAWLAYLDAQQCAVAARQAARQQAHAEEGI